LAIAHIGDSRAYLLRDARLRRITEDHTLGTLMSRARTSAILAPVMSRFLDGRLDRSPDLALREANPGDRYLLCSDGLSGVIAMAALQNALVSAGDPSAAVRKLIQLANDAGGPDNITAIVIDVLDDDQPGHVQATTLGGCRSRRPGDAVTPGTLGCQSGIRLFGPGPLRGLITLQNLGRFHSVTWDDIHSYLDRLAVTRRPADPHDLHDGKHDRDLEQGGLILGGQAAAVEFHPFDRPVPGLFQPVQPSARARFLVRDLGCVLDAARMYPADADFEGRLRYPGR